MPAIYHEGSWLGNATDPEVLVKDTVGWTGKNRAYSQTNNAVIAHIENGITYDVSWTGSATVTLKKNSTSGATITSGSTSPLSFTADADYELYFGSSATVTNIMVKDSRITDSTYEPYHESVQNQLNAQGVLGAKNLLQNTATSQTINGITFTVNADKSVTVNGTATATTNLALEMTPEFDSAVILSGCPLGGAANKYSIQYSSWVSGVPIYADYGEGVIIPNAFNKSTYPNARIFINITNGQTISNLTFKPMIRLASDPDDTYQPYAMTNRELTQNKLDNVFRSNTYGAYNGDLNDLTDGIRYCNGASANVPVTNAWGFCQTYYGGSANRIQLYFTNVGKIYSRVFDSSTWMAWKEITMA